LRDNRWQSGGSRENFSWPVFAVCQSLLKGGIPVGNAILAPKPYEIVNRLEIRAHTAGRRHMLAAQLKTLFRVSNDEVLVPLVTNPTNYLISI
jgi:hypothetical protein